MDEFKNDPPHLAAALSHALCCMLSRTTPSHATPYLIMRTPDISRQRRERVSMQSVSKGFVGEVAHSPLEARILIISPGNDDPAQYISLMNTFFAAAKEVIL